MSPTPARSQPPAIVGPADGGTIVHVIGGCVMNGSFPRCRFGEQEVHGAFVEGALSLGT